MEIYQLKTFAAVAELEHLTRAAERLHVSQPAASAHIKALEEELGLSLFERRGSRLALTQAGRDMLPLVAELLSQTRRLKGRAEEIAGTVRGTLKIGALFDPDLVRLAPILARIRLDHPDLEVEVYQTSSLNVIGGLQSADIDVGFAILMDVPHGLHAERLMDLTYRVMGTAAYADVLRDPDLAALARAPWIAGPPGGSQDRMLRSLFGSSALPHRPVSGNNEAMIAAMVGAGLGLGLLRAGSALAPQPQGSLMAWVGTTTIEPGLHVVCLDARTAEPRVSLAMQVVRNHFSPPGSGT